MTNYLAGQQIPAGPGYSTVLPDADFETYSEAGFPWNEATQSFDKPIGATKRGLFAVGAAVYSQHPTCEVLSLQFDLKDGRGPEFWRPGMPNPQRLFDHLAKFNPAEPPSYTQAGLLEAHNSMFEFRVAYDVCVKRYGWPAINQRQLRCSMAKCRAHALPGSLDDAGRVLNIARQKDKDGTRLLNKFSIPRKPTKTDARRRIRPEDDPVDGPKLYAYNLRDIEAEAEVSARVPDLQPNELRFWLADQAINYRGMGVDSESVAACIDILHQAQAKYNAELLAITDGQVSEASKVEQLKNWLAECGVYLDALDGDAIEEVLASDTLPADCRRALEIRQLVSSASVKKIYSMCRMATADHRLCDMHVFHGPRTGRDAHQDTQPGNFPKAGPNVRWCDNAGCGWPYAHGLTHCPACGTDQMFSRELYAPGEDRGWTWRAAPFALDVIKLRSLELVEWFFGDALLTISGCIRAMIVAGPGKDLICSDYSSIEAVVTAALAGEQWRIDTFRRKEDIYLASAARVTGKSLEWYMANGGKKHPDRQKIGKPCLGPQTQVLTDRGYLAIVDVLLTDKLWDGVEWVSHDGLLDQGQKVVLDLDGVQITPDHLVNSKGSWLAAEKLASAACLLTQALATGSESYSALARSSAAATGSTLRRSNVPVAGGRTGSQSSSKVYDLANAGPRRRFTIKTNSGHLLVHNCELGLGFGGWIGAWRQFDSSDNFTDDEVKANIVAWREASPAIVELWGGQFRGTPWAPTSMELYGLEGCAVAAIQNPGQAYAYNGITYQMHQDVLYCRLLSGKLLTYHRPRLNPVSRREGWVETLEITFEGWNTNPKKGPRGWLRMKTYGGSLAENVIQGTAADVMKFAVPNLEDAGYPVVLRVHDELAAEVPEGFGSIEEFERIMATLPDWCADWPIRAAGGWRGKRYRKD